MTRKEWAEQLHDVLLSKDQWCNYAATQLYDGENATEYFRPHCRRYKEESGQFEQLMVYTMDAHHVELYPNSGATMISSLEPVYAKVTINPYK